MTEQAQPAPPSCVRCGGPYEEHVQGHCQRPPLPQRPVPRSGGAASLFTAVICGIAGAVALVVTIYTGSAASECTSGLGQIAQGLDTSTASSCTNWTTLHDLALFATIILAFGLVISTMVHLFGRRP